MEGLQVTYINNMYSFIKAVNDRRQLLPRRNISEGRKAKRMSFCKAENTIAPLREVKSHNDIYSQISKRYDIRDKTISYPILRHPKKDLRHEHKLACKNNKNLDENILKTLLLEAFCEQNKCQNNCNRCWCKNDEVNRNYSVTTIFENQLALSDNSLDSLKHSKKQKYCKYLKYAFCCCGTQTQEV